VRVGTGLGIRAVALDPLFVLWYGFRCWVGTTEVEPMSDKRVLHPRVVGKPGTHPDWAWCTPLEPWWVCNWKEDTQVPAKKAKGDQAGEKGSAKAYDGIERDRFPHLVDWMTSVTFDDGSKRKTATLFVFCEGGVVKGCLNDRDTEEALWAEGIGFVDFLDTLETSLAAENVAWRAKTGKAKK
jgi:hypothetical protein